MNQNLHNDCRLPRVIECPHCAGQMNFTGRGKAPSSAVYLCGRCVPTLRTKELWIGQVVRTGNRGFGFVQLRGPHGLGGVHFRTNDFTTLDRGRPVPATPQTGDLALVMLGDDPQHAHRVWRVTVAKPTPQPTARPSDNGHQRANGQHRGNDRPQQRDGRLLGSITKLGGPDWGFITEFDTARQVFVHRSNLLGRTRLALGEKVSYRPERTAKGVQAREVVAE